MLKKYGVGRPPSFYFTKNNGTTHMYISNDRWLVESFCLIKSAQDVTFSYVDDGENRDGNDRQHDPPNNGGDIGNFSQIDKLLFQISAG